MQAGEERVPRGPAAPSSRCPALSPAPGSHSFPLVLRQARQRGHLELVEGKKVPFLFLL